MLLDGCRCRSRSMVVLLGGCWSVLLGSCRRGGVVLLLRLLGGCRSWSIVVLLLRLLLGVSRSGNELRTGRTVGKGWVVLGGGRSSYRSSGLDGCLGLSMNLSGRIVLLLLLLGLRLSGKRSRGVLGLHSSRSRCCSWRSYRSELLMLGRRIVLLLLLLLVLLMNLRLSSERSRGVLGLHDFRSIGLDWCRIVLSVRNRNSFITNRRRLRLLSRHFLDQNGLLSGNRSCCRWQIFGLLMVALLRLLWLLMMLLRLLILLRFRLRLERCRRVRQMRLSAGRQVDAFRQRSGIVVVLQQMRHVSRHGHHQQ